MKVIISYPPLQNKSGSPTLGQNRQFQYFKEPTFIYPVVPAQAATLLKNSGHEVIWNDCLAENWGYERFLGFISSQKPDLIAFETKTPVVKQHWKIIGDIKAKAPEAKVVLFGDHVTVLPEESFENSKVDFVLTGGDYDFLLLNLCDSLAASPGKACGLFEPGIYYRDNGTVKNSGKFRLERSLDIAPIDRDLTRWQLYAYKNGNYKKTPGTYIMSARDCWWGKCSFCSWPTLYPKFRSRDPQKVLDEIGFLIEKYSIREIMDDSGCFPVGDWLHRFCDGMIKRGYNKKVYIDCNMRFGALKKEDLELMKEANFRLLLFGLESGNQSTLDRINKNLKVADIIEGCRAASRAGLYPHITVMFGYPWETYEDSLVTLKLASWLLKKGYAYTMQATMVIPYPGTPLFNECKANNWLKDLDWEDYDMKTPVMKIGFPEEQLSGLLKGMYKVSFDPEFVFRKLLSLKDADDLKYYLRAFKKVTGHLFDHEQIQR